MADKNVNETEWVVEVLFGGQWGAVVQCDSATQAAQELLRKQTRSSRTHRARHLPSGRTVGPCEAVLFLDELERSLPRRKP